MNNKTHRLVIKQDKEHTRIFQLADGIRVDISQIELEGDEIKFLDCSEGARICLERYLQQLGYYSGDS